jgi:protein-tyrosine phosphatase
VIDLHCHILPALDDGPTEIEDSVGMARQAFDDGIAIVCATPHIRHDHDVRIAELPERVAELNAELGRRAVQVRIAPGGEVAETALAGLDDDELRAVALGGHWVLLEPAPGPLSDSLPVAVAELGRRGFGALIAHPERHPAADLRERLAELVAGGALVQVTAAHLAEGPAAPAMIELAEAGLVHLLGSDAHSSLAGRPVALAAGLERLWEQVEGLRRHIDWIAREAPAAILAGDLVEPPYPVRL